MIAHRLSTIRRADQILVVEDGRIIERGTHASLYALGGRYFDLYTKQHGLQANLFLAPGEGDSVPGDSLQESARNDSGDGSSASLGASLGANLSDGLGDDDSGSGRAAANGGGDGDVGSGSADTDASIARAARLLSGTS